MPLAFTCLATPSGDLITLTKLEMMFMAMGLAGPGTLVTHWANFRACVRRAA
jgi:hypothetical protein